MSAKKEAPTEIDWSNPKEAIIQLANDFYKERVPALKVIYQNPPAALKRTPRPVRTVALYYSRLHNGGAEHVVAMICRGLALMQKDDGLKYRVLLLTDEPPSEDEYAIPDTVIRIQLPNRLRFPKEDYRIRADALYDIIDRYEVDAFIHSLWLADSFAWDELCVKTHPRHPAFIAHCHGAAAMIFEMRWKPEEMFYSYSFADGVVCLSKSDRWYWSQINGNTRMILNPIDLESDERVRTPGGGKTLLWVGRVSREKRPVDAVDILAEALKTEPDARLLIVGGNDRKADLEAVKNRAAELGVEDRVSLEGFTLDVEPYYRMADVILVTSRFEGFSLTLFEAAAHGLPIVMYNLPYLAFCDECRGWVSVPQENPGAAGRAAAELLGSRERWQESSDALFESAAEFLQKDPIIEWDDLLAGMALPLEETTSPLGDQHWIVEHIAFFHSLNSDRLQDAIDGKKEEIARLRGSRSYRLARKMAAPLRVVRRR